MVFKSTQVEKGFPSLLTNIGLFSTMSQFMFSQATQTKAGFSTLLTDKGCLSSVNPYMPFKESGSSKDLPQSLHLNSFSSYTSYSSDWCPLWVLKGRLRDECLMKTYLHKQLSLASNPVGVSLLLIWSGVWLKISPHGIPSYSKNFLITCLQQRPGSWSFLPSHLCTVSVVNDPAKPTPPG